MNARRCSWLVAASLLAGCGDTPLLQDATGQFRILARCEAKPTAGGSTADPLAATLGEHPAVDVLLLHDDQLAERCAPLLRDQKPRLLVASAPLGMAREAVQTGRWAAAVELGNHEARGAIDLAVLACRGIEVPRRVPIGARFLTRANLAAGGSLVPAPGDFALQAMRLQHGAILAAGSDAVLRLACVTTADAFGTAVQQALAGVSAPGVQLSFVAAAAAGDDAAFAAALRSVLPDNPSAVLVVTRDAGAAAAEVRAEVLQRGIKVLVFGAAPADEQFTCWLGPDQAALGRAAAEALRQIAPLGASLLEIHRGTAGGDALHQSFVGALGLQAPR